MTSAPPPLWLASQSPRRRELLTQIGIGWSLLLADEHEDAEALEAERPGETPDDYVQRVCLAKAHAAQSRLRARGWPVAPVLSADTTVTIDNLILGKPADAAQAFAMLQRLSGRAHRVLSAVAITAETLATPLTALSESIVTFAPLTDSQIQAYIATGEPFGKAGAYGIQGHAATFIAHLAGSYSGVMGLPLFETARLLRDAGVLTA